MDLTLASAVDIAAAIARGDVSVAEMLDAVLDRYERHNPAVNAVILTDVERARLRAAQLDGVTARGELVGPLHGVPMTIKEALDWAGTPSTWGVADYADNVASRTATAVQRLEDAGAVVYGKTNVPEYLGDWQSFNAIYGTTNNPWDLDRVPGGSSGGSAAALATGMAALELGSDIGASIRNPAHYCGVFGHNPTFGLVPGTGHLPPGQLVSPDIATVGPLARSAADLDLALAVIAGPDLVDGTAYAVDLPPPPAKGLADYRVAVVLDSPVLAQDDELTAQLRSTVDALGAAGVDVDTDAGPAVDHHVAWENYVIMLRATLAGGQSDEQMERHRDDAARYEAGDRDYVALAARGYTLDHRSWLARAEERERMRQRWAEFFRSYDLLLCPIAASAAFPHDHTGTRPERTIPVNGAPEPCVDQLFWAGWSNNMALPATVAPAGSTASGLPCGLQIVAPRLADRTAIAFAGLMERELGGYVPPPMVDTGAVETAGATSIDGSAP